MLLTLSCAPRPGVRGAFLGKRVKKRGVKARPETPLGSESRHISPAACPREVFFSRFGGRSEGLDARAWDQCLLRYFLLCDLLSYARRVIKTVNKHFLVLWRNKPLRRYCRNGTVRCRANGTFRFLARHAHCELFRSGNILVSRTFKVTVKFNQTAQDQKKRICRCRWVFTSPNPLGCLIGTGPGQCHASID